MMDGLGVEKRIGESESMKNARLEVDAAKKGDYNSREKFHSSRETTFSGGIFPSHERVGSAEYERETERLMEALAKRIATGQHHSADFNDARRHVREHRMRNNLVHVDNAEVMRLREAKRQLRDDFLQMGPKCEFDTSGMSRESIKDMKEECKEFFREEENESERYRCWTTRSIKFTQITSSIASIFEGIVKNSQQSLIFEPWTWSRTK